MTFFKKTVKLPADQTTYNDINADWLMEPIESVQDIDSLHQAVLLVLSTRKGSRKWRERFGSNLYTRLFEPFGDQTADWIRSDILDALEDKYNGLADDLTDIRCAVIPDNSTQTYYVSVSWTAVKLARKSPAHSFRLRRSS